MIVPHHPHFLWQNISRDVLCWAWFQGRDWNFTNIWGESQEKSRVFSCWDVKKLRTWWFQEQWMGIQCENDGTAWLILVRYEGEDEPNHHKFRLRSHQNVRISHGRWMKFCRVRVILAFNRQHLRTQKLLLDIPWFLAFCPSNWLSKKVS